MCSSALNRLKKKRRIPVRNDLCGDGPWAQTCTVRPQFPSPPPSPPIVVSGAGWDTHIWHFSQEVSRFWWRLSLHAYPLQYLALSTANRWAPHQPSLPSPGLQQHPRWGQGLLTLLLPLFLSLCFHIASASLCFLTASRVSNSEA